MTTQRTDRWPVLLSALAIAAAAAAQGSACSTSMETDPGTSAMNASGGGSGGHGGDDGSILVGSGPTSSGSDGTVTCTKPCDAATEVCSHGTCVPLVLCKSDSDCQNDTRCEPMSGCLPWDGKSPPYDPGCINVSAP